MKVLGIIGFLALLIVIIIIIDRINAYSQKHYKYEFFSWANFTITSLGYASMYFGNSWYHEALLENGDILNGQLLISIGAFFVIAILVNHIKKTSVLFGTFFGLFQLILYVPAAIVGFIGLLMLFAWASETKPVYRIN